MIDQFVNVLVDKLREAAAPYENAVFEGKCGTFEEYKFNAGVIRGLLGAISIAQDLAKLAEEIDD